MNTFGLNNEKFGIRGIIDHVVVYWNDWVRFSHTIVQKVMSGMEL